MDKAISKASDAEKETAINFWRAVRIPVRSFVLSLDLMINLKINFSIWTQGVMEYSFSLFFTKLINYTFLYWLPKYLKDSSTYF